MTIGFFDSLILILLSAVLVIVIARRINVPVIIAYIVIGLIVGTPAIGWIPNTEVTHTVAKFGVVFLMFTIGLEFSLKRLIEMRRIVFGLGAAQVVLTATITIVVGHWLGMTLIQAMVVGFIVAMSSTAIVSKQLVDQHELGSLHGQHSIAILLFQDLAVIPFFILISSFSNGTVALNITLLAALGKTVVAIGIISIAGYWLLRPLFREIVTSESLELFTLSVLLVILGASWFTQRLGLSLALGGFMAGMMLGETEFRHQIESTIRPFRDLLLGLFFITVGMLFQVENLSIIWPWVLLLFTALTIFKIGLIASLTYFPTKNADVSLRTGLVLAQGGEFGFALLSLAVADNLLPELYGQVVLGALLFSMALAPVLIRYSGAIAKFILPKNLETKERAEKAGVNTIVKSLKKHVIICGFGRTGHHITKILDDEEISNVALDLDYSRVVYGQREGRSVIYGDASLYDMLLTCKIKQASAVVIAFKQPLLALKIVEQLRTHHKKLPIYVLTSDDSELDALQAVGATEVIPESFTVSLTIASHVLLQLGVSAGRVTRLVNKLRRTRYGLLRPMIQDDDGPVAPD